MPMLPDPSRKGDPSTLVVHFLCLFSGASLLSFGCTPRSFNTQGKPLGMETEFQDPPGSLPLVPPSDDAADVVSADSSGSPVFPPDANGKPMTDATLLMNPVRYFEEVIIHQKRTPPLPAPFPEKSVLEAMRKVRTLFYRSTPNEDSRTPPSVAGMKPTLDELKALGLSALSMESDIFPKAPNDPEIRDRCTDFGIPHYSDIMLHYYCQIPSIWRGCHRVLSLAVSKADDSDLNLEKKKQTRQWVLETCNTKTDDDFKEKVSEMFTKPVDTLPKVAIFFTQARITKPYFQAFHETQWTTNENGDQVNMFNFIMGAQPYAFAPRDEAAVINAYYGEMKPASQGTFDPTDKADCHAWRLPRKEEDPTANYCDWRTPKISPVHSIGR